MGADQSFSKSIRLCKADEFVQVLRHPQVNIHFGPLRLRARMNRMPHARLGLVVTKKGTPKAVRRNRIKRLIREQYRHDAATLPAVDMVVQVFADTQDAHLLENLKRGFDQVRKHKFVGEEAC